MHVMQCIVLNFHYNAYRTLLVVKHGLFMIGEQFTEKELVSEEFGFHKCAILGHSNLVRGKLNPFCGRIQNKKTICL